MSFVGSNQTANTTTGTSVVVTVSGYTINAGDVLFLAFGSSQTSSSPTFPAGFAAISGLTSLVPLSDNNSATWVCQSKIAVGGESSFTITNGSSGWLSGFLLVYRGRTATPFVVTPVTTAVVARANSPLSISLTGITPNARDDVVAIMPMGSLGNANAWNLTTPPSAFGDVQNFASPVQNQPVLVSCDCQNWPGGATGTLTATVTSPSAGYKMGYGGWVMALAAAPPYVRIQSASASSFTTGVSSLSATFSSAVTPGNTIIAYVGCVDAAPSNTYTVSDTVNSGNYVLDTPSTAGGNFPAGIFRLSAAAAGTPMVTVQRATGASTSHLGLVIEEWAGFAPTNPADQPITNFNGVLNQTPTSGNTGNYFESGELMLSCGVTPNHVTWTAGSGYTMSPQTSGGLDGFFAAQSGVLPSATGTSATFSLSSTQFWQVAAVAYKPAQPNLGAQTVSVQTGGLSAASINYGLTNQSSTSSVGTITSEVDITLGSLSATFVEGQLLNQIGLTGQTASFTEGTITTAISGNVILALSGQSMGFAQGQLSLGISYLLDQDTITLVGQTATFALGVLQPGLIIPLTAQTLASAEGTIISAPSYTLGSLTITSLEGSITSSLGNNTNLSLIGQAITSSQGAMQFLPGATFPTNTLTFTEGTITFSATGDFTVSLTGLVINSSEGTITFTGSAPGFLTMPNVVGIGWLHASHILEKAGLFQTQPPLRVLSKVYPTYTVLGQEPPAGSLVPLNSAVQLTVSIDAPLLGASFDVLPLF